MSEITEKTLAVLEAEDEAYRNNERGYLEFWAVTASHFRPLIAEVRRLREELMKQRQIAEHSTLLAIRRHDRILDLERDLANEKTHSAWTAARAEMMANQSRKQEGGE